MTDPDMDWPFDQPRNSAALTTRQVMSGGEPILTVHHDEEDHGWQFIGATPANEADRRVSGLGDIVNMDPSVAEVSDIAPGWTASREAVGQPWVRQRNPRSAGDDPWGLDRGVTPTSLGGAFIQSIGRFFQSK